MTSLTSVFLSGLSGLRAAQTGISVASQNITNASTPGYVRAELTLSPNTQFGAGAGVNVTAITRAADRFLSAASYFAGAANGAATARADVLNRAQAHFGDPSSETSMFARMDQLWSALAELGVDPSSALRRGDVVSALAGTYSEIQRVAQSLEGLRSEADQRIADGVAEAQDLINRIAGFNREIQLTRRAGADATGAENAQSQLIDRLSELLDVRVTPSEGGGVQVRTTGGALLVGVNAAQIRYTPAAPGALSYGVITINEQLGIQSNLESTFAGGAIGGLLQARDHDLVGLSEALGGFSAALADVLNEVHNENASAPPLGVLAGRQTGLIGADAIGFTGNATIGVVDSSGNLAERLSIDFDAQTITTEAPAGSFSFAGGTIDDFVTALNSALGAATPAGSASFSGGALTLQVGSGGGLVVQQDSADPSARAGRGFSHFFGLNDLVTRPTPLFFESGVSGTDPHGFNNGGAITYEIRDNSGRFVAERTVSLPLPGAGPHSWNDLLGALNATGTGFGEFGTFALDPATGQVSFTTGATFQAELVADSTQRGATGVSFSALNGLSSAATAGRATEAGVKDAIITNANLLAGGKPDLSLALGERVIEPGDNRGATALLAARDSVRTFPTTGVLTTQTTSLAVFASRLGGEAGRLAADAARAATGAAAVSNAANDRRAQMESVSLDDELIRMTTYQNAYAASARVIQAATEMLDILMAIGYR